MSRTYSLSTFFRMVPNSMLRGFFDRHGVNTSEPLWKYVKERDIEPFLTIFNALPREKQIEFDGIFQEIYELACPSGFEALKKAAEYFSEKLWLVSFAKQPSLYVIAFWSRSAFPKMFAYALSLHKVQSLSWWRKREGLPQTPPEWNEEIKGNLEGALQDYFKGNQNRGEICTIETHYYGEGIHYYLAYLDDYTRKVHVHDHQKALVTKTTRPTFDVVFAYSSREGTLELHAKGSEKMKKELEEIFINQVIGETIELPLDAPYHLDALLSNRFALEADFEDGLSIRLDAIELYWEEHGSLCCKPNKNRNIFDVIAEGINYPLEKAKVLYAKFQFVFLSTESQRGGSMTFEIAAPNRCTFETKILNASKSPKNTYKNGELNMKETLSRILHISQGGSGTFSRDGSRDLPFENLEKWGWTTPDGLIDSRRCEERHDVTIIHAKHPLTGKDVYLESCECGLEEVDEEKLRCWRVRNDVILERTATALRLRGEIAEALPNLLWNIGRKKGVDFFYLRVLREKTRRTICNELRNVKKAIVVCATARDATTLQYEIPHPCTSLETIGRLDQDGQLIIDPEVMEDLLGVPTEEVAPPVSTAKPRGKRDSRAVKIEQLVKEMEQHLRLARAHALATAKFGNIELLPRPSQDELAERTGMNKTDVSRCLKDPTAKVLRLLWEKSNDLGAITR